MLSNLFQLEPLVTLIGPSVVYSKRNPFICPSVHLIYLYFGLGMKWTVLRLYINYITFMCILRNYNLPFIPKGYQIRFLTSWTSEDGVKG
jgi:hypothetical protein